MGQVISSDSGNGLVMDTTNNSVTATEVSNFFIPLPKKIAAGETVQLKIQGEDRSLSGFRVRLSTGTDGSSAASDWIKSIENNITGIFTWDLSMLTTAEAQYVEVKGYDYQHKIEDLTLNSISIVTEKGEEGDKEEEEQKEFQKITLSPELTMGTAALEGTPIYNEDGSVTLTLKNEYGGGGIALYLQDDKKAIDIDQYSKILIDISTEGSAPLSVAYYENGMDYWQDNGLLGYAGVEAERKTLSFSLSSYADMNAIRLRYNSWNLPSDAKVTITVHSITLVRDLRDITDATTKYTSLYQLAEQYGLKLGTVMNDTTIKDNKYSSLMKYHFNSLTAANEMKAYSMLDGNTSKANYVDENSMPAINFTNADKIMDYAKENGIKVRGHVLVWDADMCDWFFREGYDTSKGYASAEVNKKRMESYIKQVLTHFEEKYPGVIYCWDVVNEAVGDNAKEYESTDPRHVRTLRGEKTNLFYDHVGSDYVELAFLYARQTLQKMNVSNIDLYYNDYSTFYAEKRDAICQLITSINTYQSDGNGGYVKLCDGMGMQSYIGGFGAQPGCMNDNDISLVKTAILKFADLDVDVQVTELAVRNYENDAETVAKHAAFYQKLFQAYLEVNKECAKKPLKAVSIWGIVDNPSMSKDDYSYRMNGLYCGLFDENLKVKPSFESVYALLGGVFQSNR